MAEWRKERSLSAMAECAPLQRKERSLSAMAECVPYNAEFIRDGGKSPNNEKSSWCMQLQKMEKRIG